LLKGFQHYWALPAVSQSHSVAWHTVSCLSLQWTPHPFVLKWIQPRSFPRARPVNQILWNGVEKRICTEASIILTTRLEWSGGSYHETVWTRLREPFSF
jgi:hypothetical protein